MSSLINKTRKPKFEVHLKIADLNNVPLVSGGSFVKWHLPHSIHKEHRGRTPKCPIVNHRVEYNYGKVLIVRIPIDRNNNLAECAIEFEVVQEFTAPANGSSIARDEKVTLGNVRLNLSEYVDESEAILRDPAATAYAARDSFGSPIQKTGHRRGPSSLGNSISAAADESSPRSSREEDRPVVVDDDVQDGVMRRYLLQDSKINSTLKISILMIQIDGDRNFTAPPPKSTPIFGAIAGFVVNESLEPVDPGARNQGSIQSSFAGKSREVYELQDMYRRALAASWASQPGELPADQCIEDIFAGGDGFIEETRGHSRHHNHHRHHHRHHHHHHHHSRRRARSSSSSPSPPRNLRQGSAMTAIFSGGSSFKFHHSDNDLPTTDDTDDQYISSSALRTRDATARLRRQLSHQTVSSDRSGATTVVAAPSISAAAGNSQDSNGPSPGPGVAEMGMTPLYHPNSNNSNNSNNGHFYRERGEPFPSFSSTVPIIFHPPSLTSLHRREESKITHDGRSSIGGFADPRSRSSSLVSLAASTASAGTMRELEGNGVGNGYGGAGGGYTSGGSNGGGGRRGGRYNRYGDRDSDEMDYYYHRNGGVDGVFKRTREVDEFEVREDLVAWTIPSASASTLGPSGPAGETADLPASP